MTFLKKQTASEEAEDEEILSLIQDKNTVFVLNKMDLEQKAELSDKIKASTTVSISAKTGAGLEGLQKTIEEMFSLGSIIQKQEETVINMRHKQAVQEALSALKNALLTLEMGLPADLLSVDMRVAIESLGTITGQTVSDEIVEEIFSRFCLGK